MVVEWVVERHVKLEGNEDVSKFKMTDLSVKFKVGFGRPIGWSFGPISQRYNDD